MFKAYISETQNCQLFWVSHCLALDTIVITPILQMRKLRPKESLREVEGCNWKRTRWYDRQAKSLDGSLSFMNLYMDLRLHFLIHVACGRNHNRLSLCENQVMFRNSKVLCM